MPDWSRFLAEVRRRKVYRVTVTYAVAGLGVLGAAEVILEPLGLSAARTAIVVATLAGLPIAMVLAWAYDLRIEARPVLADADDPALKAPDGPEGQDSIVVLPFDNMSPDPNDAYFCDGLTEEIITSLSFVRSLRVISRSSAVVLKEAQMDVRAIGRELDVRYVLEGSVRKAGNDLRITAQLIDAGTDQHLWAQKYDRELQDVFAIQEEIAEDVVGRMLGSSRPETESPREIQATDVEAYGDYLRGRFHWNKHTLDGYWKAVAAFEEALAIDPGYAPAYAGVASCFFWMGFLEGLPPDEVFPKGKAAAQRAIDLDPTLADAHGYLAGIRMVHDWAWEEAEAGFLRAIELEPQAPLVRQIYTVFLGNVGRLEDALVQNSEYLRIDPLSMKAWQDRGYWSLLAGRFEDARDACDRALELDPNFPLAFMVKAFALIHLGHFEDAIEAVSTGSERAGHGPMFRACVACALAYGGRTEQAQEALEEMEKGEDYIPAVLFAWICASLGLVDRAFDYLEQALAERSSMLLSAPSFSFWDPLRSDPRFDAILDAMGLTGIAQAPQRELLTAPARGTGA